MKVYAGIDVGGTKTAIGVFGEDKTLLGKAKFPSDPSLGAEEFFQQTAGRLRELAVADGAFRRTYFLVRHRSKYLTDGMQRALQVVREEIAAR